MSRGRGECSIVWEVLRPITQAVPPLGAAEETKLISVQFCYPRMLYLSVVVDTTLGLGDIPPG
jgi:hypothetical protein